MEVSLVVHSRIKSERNLTFKNKTVKTSQIPLHLAISQQQETSDKISVFLGFKNSGPSCQLYKKGIFFIFFPKKTNVSRPSSILNGIILDFHTLLVDNRGG